MAGISNFMKGQGNKGKKFEKQLEGCESKADERKLERRLCKPAKIPPYTGPSPSRDAAHPLAPRTVMVVLQSGESAELFKKHFPVSTHVTPSLSNVKLLMALVRALEDGSIVYDAKKDEVRVGEV